MLVTNVVRWDISKGTVNMMEINPLITNKYKADNHPQTHMIPW